MSQSTHLHDTIRDIAQQSAEDRIAHLRKDRWVDYPIAERALARLEILLETPRRTRMPCLLIYAESGMGKTMIAEKFLRAHRPVYVAERGIERIDVLAVQMPPSPSQNRFYGEILTALEAPYRPSDRLFAVETVALSLLRDLKPRIIIVDEVHHLLAGSPREQRASLNLLKFLANKLQCAIVALGTMEARAAMQTDAQMNSRFKPVELPRWRDGDVFRASLKTFEQLLPLREPSRFANQQFAREILRRGGGITGNITELLVQAAELALRTDRESVTLEMLEEVAGVAVA